MKSRGNPILTKVIIGFTAAFVILGVVAVSAEVTTRRLRDSIAWESHTNQVIGHVDEVAIALRAAEAAQRGYLATGDSAFVSGYDRARAAIDSRVDTLQSAVSDNADQVARVGELDARIAQRLVVLDSGITLRGGGRLDLAQDLIRSGAGARLRGQVDTLIGGINREESRLLAQRQATVARMLHVQRIVNFGGIAVSGILVAISLLLIIRDLRLRRAVELALEESEARTRDFLDTASDLIQSSAPDGKLIYANQSLLDTLGYTEQEIVGKSAGQLIAPECLELGEVLFERIMSGETVRDIRLTYLRKDGRRVFVEGSSSARFVEGKAVATRTILRDVTKQREVERMKDEFVGVVSHELRTPLTSIRGALGLLAGGLLGEIPERGRRMLDVAIANTDRLVRLINDILDVERIQSGEVPMVRRSVQLAELVDGAVEVMNGQAAKAGVIIDSSAEDIVVDADADRIVQALTNLLSNAIKFSPSGTTVRVTAVTDGASAHIRVADQGRGIPQEKLDVIFERFQQVDASDAREKGGSGLGLAISRGIVEQHGGRMWVESVLNVGSTFHITLPVHRLRDAPSLEQTERTGPLILVCDDDADVRVVLGDILEDRGYRVATAADGASAIELAARERPAAILLDLLMPGLDGWSTLARLKERVDTRDVPVVIITGSSESRDNETVLRKPLDAAQLFSAVDSALARWGEGRKVLVVEDDEDLAPILVEFLRGRGLDPVHARDGNEAVQLSQQQEPALIILDLMLPDTDGFAVVDWLRRHDRLRDVPIMVYTARDLSEAERAQLGVSPATLFTKSRVPPADLVGRVASIVGRITYQDRRG